MDVNRDNFFWVLPRILREAENSQFVAIDIEMSGISWSSGHLVPIQDAYAKIKEAAEEYQILQIGFTFIQYVQKTSEYITRTIHCNVSPLFPKGHFNDSLARHLNRKFSVSTRSYSFLRLHGLNLNHTLDNGVHYLSRQDQKLAEEFCTFKDSEKEIIDPSTLDKESQQFYKETRIQITEFANTRSQTQNLELIIKNPYGKQINGLQTRLIHQIISREFPNYSAKRITVGAMTGSMSVTLVTRACKIEAESRRQNNVATTKRLSGLQILFEALSGGSFADKIDQEWVCRKPGTTKGPDAWNEFNKNFDFHRCEANLKKNKPIIIGHNSFLDLAFIYHTFFEPLPPKVDDFLTSIHRLFPRIIDTKFMHARGGHLMEQDRALSALHYYYSKQKYPLVRHISSVDDAEAGPHNAAYDSTMTATLFLKQTSYMFSRNKHMDEVEEALYVPNRQNNYSVSTQRIQAIGSLLDEDLEELAALRKWGVLTADESTSRTATPVAPSPTPTPLPERSGQQNGKMPTGFTRERQIVPAWEDGFWRVYGNKTSIPGAGLVSFV